MAGRRKKLTIKGIEFPSIAAAAEYFGIKQVTLGARIRKWPNNPDKWIDNQQSVSLEIDGKKFTSIRAAALHFGIEYHVFFRRYKNYPDDASKWTCEDQYRISVAIKGQSFDSLSEAANHFRVPLSSLLKRRAQNPNNPDSWVIRQHEKPIFPSPGDRHNRITFVKELPPVFKNRSENKYLKRYRRLACICDCGRPVVFGFDKWGKTFECKPCSRKRHSGVLLIKCYTDLNLAEEPRYLYIASYDTVYWKVGVSKQPKRRQETSFYQEFTYVSQSLPTCVACAVERCVLFRTRWAAPKPIPSQYRNKGGTEIRYKEKLDLQTITQMFAQQIQRAFHIGWKELVEEECPIGMFFEYPKYSDNQI